MKARRSIFTIVVVVISSLLILFNNCSKPESESTPSVYEPPVATEIVGRLMARVQDSTTYGKVYGYAMDSGNKTAVLRVIFYLNGVAGSGTYLGETIAKERSPGTYDGHHFSFQVPQQYATGQQMTLYVYANDDSPENLVYPAPFGVIAFTPKGPSFFNQNIAPFVSANCVRCHSTSWTYEYMFFGPLLNPLPTSGGSPTNNKLIRKMNGMEGHNGGPFCQSGNDTGFCANIQAWWRSEFQ